MLCVIHDFIMKILWWHLTKLAGIDPQLLVIKIHCMRAIDMKPWLLMSFVRLMVWMFWLSGKPQNLPESTPWTMDPSLLRQLPTVTMDTVWVTQEQGIVNFKSIWRPKKFDVLFLSCFESIFTASFIYSLPNWKQKNSIFMFLSQDWHMNMSFRIFFNP